MVCCLLCCLRLGVSLALSLISARPVTAPASAGEDGCSLRCCCSSAPPPPPPRLPPPPAHTAMVKHRVLQIPSLQQLAADMEAEGAVLPPAAPTQGPVRPQPSRPTPQAGQGDKPMLPDFPLFPGHDLLQAHAGAPRPGHLPRQGTGLAANFTLQGEASRAALTSTMHSLAAGQRQTWYSCDESEPPCCWQGKGMQPMHQHR